MTNSFLRVTFPQMDNLKYNNTGSWRCLEFKNCDFWQPARSVSWVNLPTNKFAMFFEAKKCEADGKFVLISKQGLKSGINKFRSFQPIRSMTIGENHNYSHHPLSTQFKCPYYYREATDTLNDMNVNMTSSFECGSDDGSAVYEGVSTNWYDALPDPTDIP